MDITFEKHFNMKLVVIIDDSVTSFITRRKEIETTIKICIFTK